MNLVKLVSADHNPLSTRYEMTFSSDHTHTISVSEGEDVTYVLVNGAATDVEMWSRIKNSIDARHDGIYAARGTSSGNITCEPRTYEIMLSGHVTSAFDFKSNMIQVTDHAGKIYNIDVAAFEVIDSNTIANLDAVVCLSTKKSFNK